MWSFRRVRVVTCPETHQIAAVRGKSRLTSCSGWPERAGCDQACLKEIATSPDGCLLKSRVAAWYTEKSCVECKRPIGEIVWHEAPPALRLLDGASAEWGDFKPEDLPNLFETSEPLCWYCNNADELIKLRPGLIVRRNRSLQGAAPPPLTTRNVY